MSTKVGICYKQLNPIGGVMVSMLASGAVDRGFIGGVMVSMLASSAVDRGLDAGQIKPMTMKLVFVASLLNMQH